MNTSATSSLDNVAKAGAEPDIVRDAALMNAELETDPVLKPSVFWADLNKKNIEWLSKFGMESCRRTVSMNYFNWLIVSPHHALFRAALKAWLHHPSLAPLRATIEKDVTVTIYIRDTPLRLNLLNRTTYKLFVALVWDQMLRVDKLKIADRVEEPTVGNPIRIHHRGRLIANDLCCAIVEANVILPLVANLDRPRFAEIGAGYGRLAYVLSKMRPSLYCIFDIPPALQVSEWYLSRVLPEKRIFQFRHFDRFEEIADELEKSDIAFFTPNQMRLIPPDYFDVVSSISTLPELTAKQVDLFLELMQRTSRGFIFLKQWHRWKNDKDDTDLTIESYRFSPDWHLSFHATDPLIPTFFNAVWSKGPSPSPVKPAWA